MSAERLVSSDMNWINGSCTSKDTAAQVTGANIQVPGVAIEFNTKVADDSLPSSTRSGYVPLIQTENAELQSNNQSAILRSAQFYPANLSKSCLPEVFSLGDIVLEDDQVAAVCPIFWEESIFIDGKKSESQCAASFMESAALQVFSQSPDRVRVIVYDPSLESGVPSLEAAAELIRSKSKKHVIKIIRSIKDFEDIFRDLVNLAKERKSRLALDGRAIWKEILQQDNSTDAVLLLIRNPYDLFEKLTFANAPEFFHHAPRMGILTWIDGTNKPEIADQYRRTRISEWTKQIKSSCQIRFEIVNGLLLPAEELLRFQPFSTYSEFGGILPTAIDYIEQVSYIKALNNSFAEANQTQRRDFISIEIGRKNGQPFILGIGPKSDVYHAILAGATGSGKTVFLKLLLTLICEKYSETEVLIHLYDFKGGANLNFYRGIPNFINLFECRNQPELALQAFDRYDQEATRRQKVFNDAQTKGMIGEDLSAYNEWATMMDKPNLPVQLLIIDELGQLYRDFKDNREKSYQLRADFNRKIDKTASQGRSQGMFLLLSSQHFDDMEIDGAIANTQLRMSMRLDRRSQCSKIFDSGNIAAYENLPKTDTNAAREILINCESGRIAANQIVKLPFVTHEMLAPRLTCLKTQVSQSNSEPNSLSIHVVDVQKKLTSESTAGDSLDQNGLPIIEIFSDWGDLPEVL